MVHRGTRSEYGAERWLVRRTAYRDPLNGETMARNTFGMKFFCDGLVLNTPKKDGALDKD